MKIKSVYNIGDVLAVQNYGHEIGEYMFGEVKEINVSEKGSKAVISYTIDFGYPIHEKSTTTVVNETPQSDNEYYNIVYKVGENKNHIVDDQF